MAGPENTDEPYDRGRVKRSSPRRFIADVIVERDRCRMCDPPGPFVTPTVSFITRAFNRLSANTDFRRVIPRGGHFRGA